MRKFKDNIKLHPVLTCLILIAIVIIISGIGDALGLQTSYYKVNPITGKMESELVQIDSIFNRTGLQYIVSNMLSNFINFAPLGTLIVGLLGVGVAYKSGFLTTLFKSITKKVPRKFITFMIILLGIILSMFFEMAYVILIPLSAILFMTLKRHPSAGICAAFAGITFGYGANIVVNGLDSILNTYTSSASLILDSTYQVSLRGNLFLMIISTFLIAYVGMFVTEKYIIPKLGKYNYEEDEEEEKEITRREKKGLTLSLLNLLILGIITIYCIIPGLPFSGLFLYLKDTAYVDQLFGSNSYFNQGIVFIISAYLMIAGLIYGLRVKTIKSNKDFVDAMGYYLTDISSILVLIFFASQLISIFKKSNIGIFITASLAEAIGSLEVTGILLILLTFIIVLISSIFVPAASTKWAILAPVLVPMFMTSSMTPEFATAVFRAADSSVKGITPLFTYFILLIGFLQIYNQKKKDTITVTDAMSLMAPYTIAFSILWLLIVLGFYIIGIPIGPGINSVL